MFEKTRREVHHDQLALAGPFRYFQVATQSGFTTTTRACLVIPVGQTIGSGLFQHGKVVP